MMKFISVGTVVVSSICATKSDCTGAGGALWWGSLKSLCLAKSSLDQGISFLKEGNALLIIRWADAKVSLELGVVR